MTKTKKKTRIVGFADLNKDIAYCVLEDGRPLIHAELERYSRIKEGPRDADPYRFFMETYPEWRTCDYAVCTISSKPTAPYRKCKNSYLAVERAVKRNGGEVAVLSHHLCHAANAFYSSNFHEAIIITLDGGGEEFIETEGDGSEVNTVHTSLTAYIGKGTKLENIRRYEETLSVGTMWSVICKDVFGISVGPPFGHKAGTVMAMAAYGNPDRYLSLFIEKLDNERYQSVAEQNLKELKEAITSDDNAPFDIAATLQWVTEFIIYSIVDDVLSDPKATSKNLCLAGGVSLNSVMTHKLYKKYEDKIENIYCAPVPYDSGLAIGNAQYYWHHVLENPRVKWLDNFTPYLGELYSKENILEALEPEKDVLHIESGTDARVLNLLNKQQIVAVFGGPSESGRRALGNRSILGDPRSSTMKDYINEKAKHREPWRPFAPSILREEVVNWFEMDYDSPYMSFVNFFKEGVRDQVPAVLHVDGSARLQTVTKKDNPWYYTFLKKWQKKTGVPILLNTSFNDREPIVESPQDAINCFVTTEIDYLYFYEYGILVSHREKKDGSQ